MQLVDDRMGPGRLRNHHVHRGLDADRGAPVLEMCKRHRPGKIARTGSWEAVFTLPPRWGCSPRLGSLADGLVAVPSWRRLEITTEDAVEMVGIPESRALRHLGDGQLGMLQQRARGAQPRFRQQLHEGRSQLLKNAYFEMLRDQSKVENFLAEQIFKNDAK